MEIKFPIFKDKKVTRRRENSESIAQSQFIEHCFEAVPTMNKPELMISAVHYNPVIFFDNELDEFNKKEFNEKLHMSTSMLEAMREFQMSVLSGDVNIDILRDASAEATKAIKYNKNSVLNNILSEILLRLEIEIAKLQYL